MSGSPWCCRQLGCCGAVPRGGKGGWARGRGRAWGRPSVHRGTDIYLGGAGDTWRTRVAGRAGSFLGNAARPMNRRPSRRCGDSEGAAMKAAGKGLPRPRQMASSILSSSTAEASDMCSCFSRLHTTVAPCHRARKTCRAAATRAGANRATQRAGANRAMQRGRAAGRRVQVYPGAEGQRLPECAVADAVPDDQHVARDLPLVGRRPRRRRRLVLLLVRPQLAEVRHRGGPTGGEAPLLRRRAPALRPHAGRRHRRRAVILMHLAANRQQHAARAAGVSHPAVAGVSDRRGRVAAGRVRTAASPQTLRPPRPAAACAESRPAR